MERNGYRQGRRRPAVQQDFASRTILRISGTTRSEVLMKQSFRAPAPDGMRPFLFGAREGLGRCMAVFAAGGHGGNHLPHIPAEPAYLGAGGGMDLDTPWAPGRPRRPDLPGGADAGSAPAPSRREAYGIKSIRKRVVGTAPGKGRYRPSALRSIIFYHSITRPIICNRVKQLPAPWL